MQSQATVVAPSQSNVVNNDGVNMKSNTKGSGKPWYIISQDNKLLNIFRITMGILAVPSVIFNLFL